MRTYNVHVDRVPTRLLANGFKPKPYKQSLRSFQA